MSTDSENLLSSFDALPLPEQRGVAAAILRRAANWDNPALSDDDLVHVADELFLAFDQHEAADGS